MTRVHNHLNVPEYVRLLLLCHLPAGSLQGCWIIRTNLDSYGYGRAAGDLGPAHRVMYEALIGPIPEGLTIDHFCRVHNCLNPFHMEPVTRGENTHRTRRTACARGHTEFWIQQFTKEGKPNGRRCGECQRIGARERYQRQRALPSIAG